MYRQNEKYTKSQQDLHDKIDSLHKQGWSYRRITKYLNDNGVLTPRGKKWGETGNSVYSVLKRHRERLERLEFMEEDYEPSWGKMRVTWERNW